MLHALPLPPRTSAWSQLHAGCSSPRVATGSAADGFLERPLGWRNRGPHESIPGGQAILHPCMPSVVPLGRCATFVDLEFRWPLGAWGSAVMNGGRGGVLRAPFVWTRQLWTKQRLNKLPMTWYQRTSGFPLSRVFNISYPARWK